jgi:nucleotide-binding universal stress UspA family protein
MTLICNLQFFFQIYNSGISFCYSLKFKKEHVMLKILCTTDFSKNSKFACEYAIDLTNKLNAKLTFVTTYDSGAITESIRSIREKVREATEEDLQYFVGKLRPLIKISEEPQLKVIEGETSESIVKYAQSSQQDLIVLGTKGSSGILNMLMGSVTESVIKYSKVAVLAIPVGVKDDIKGNNIILALDEKGINNPSSISVLKEFKNLPDTNIDIFHVVVPGENVKLNSSTGMLDGIVNKIIEVDGVDPVFEIKNYVDNHDDVGILAMVGRKHTFLERAFFESNTISELFASNVPVLVLPEKID